MASENVELVRRFLRFFERLNRDPRLDSSWDDALEVLAPDFEYREDPAWPGAGTYQGIAGLRQAATGYRDVFGEQHFEAEDFIDAGDRVVVFYKWWARSDRGNEAEMRQAGIFDVRDGRIVSLQVVFDREQALEQAGLRK
jgi:ketosteroid isomerase-like protein